MSSQEENVALVRGALESFQRGEIEDVISFLDPEVDVFSSPELANPGHFTGRDGWAQWAAEWLDAWETFEVEPEALDPVGENHVLLSVRQHGKGKVSGVEVEMRVCHLFELRDGMAIRYHLYPDREQALDAARAGEHA